MTGCQPGAVALTHVAGSDGAGQTSYTLKVKNVGGAPCVFQNQPRLALLGAGGKSLPTHADWTGKPANITIRAGETVRAQLRFSPDVPGRGEGSHGGPCEPVAQKVRVYLSLHLKTLGHVTPVTGAVRPPTRVCEHGRMTGSALH